MTDDRLDAMAKLVDEGVFERIPVDPPLWRFTKKGQELNIERVAFGSTLMIQQMAAHLNKIVEDARDALFRIHNNIPFGIEDFAELEEDDEADEHRPSQLTFELEQEADEPQTVQKKFDGKYL